MKGAGTVMPKSRKPSSSKRRAKTPGSEQTSSSEPVVALPGRTLEESIELAEYLDHTDDVMGKPANRPLIWDHLLALCSPTSLDESTLQSLAPQGLTITAAKLRYARTYTLCGLLLKQSTVGRIAGVSRNHRLEWYESKLFCRWMERVLEAAGLMPAWLARYAAVKRGAPTAAAKYIEHYGHLLAQEQASPFEGMDIPDPSTAVDMAKAAKSKGGAVVEGNDTEAETPGGGGDEGGLLYHISPLKNEGVKIDEGEDIAARRGVPECEEYVVGAKGGIPVSKGDTVEFSRNGDIRVKVGGVSPTGAGG